MSNELAIVKQPENWIHFCGTSSLILMRSEYQQEKTYTSYEKPSGLWITPEYAENNWYDWAYSENFAVQNLKVIHDVKLKSTAKLVRIENAEEMDEFSERYKTRGIYAKNTRYGIDWKKVADLYHGILIPNYIYERRMQTDWYYGWDCSSGCIWDAEAIESITARVKELVEDGV